MLKIGKVNLMNLALGKLLVSVVCGSWFLQVCTNTPNLQGLPSDFLAGACASRRCASCIHAQTWPSCSSAEGLDFEIF